MKFILKLRRSAGHFDRVLDARHQYDSSIECADIPHFAPFVPIHQSRVRQKCWGLWVVLGEGMLGIKVRMVGDQPPIKQNALVLANHNTDGCLSLTVIGMAIWPSVI